MNKKEILTILAEIIHQDSDYLQSLPEGTNLADLGMESLVLIQFIVALEEAYGFEILDSDLLPSNFQTIDMLFHTLEKYFHPSDILKKVLICDCDHCLWHGIAGEETLSTDAAALSLQRELIALYEKGILLCLCSKNDPTHIAEAFARPDMLLKPEHILLSKINRQSKADNLLRIAEELHLSTDSFVFLDDSDYEIGLINALLPDVTTFKVDLHQLDTLLPKIRACFSQDTAESDRTRQYREQKNREKAKAQYTTVEEYNTSLDTRIICEEAVLQQADRIAELSQRTNQCNLSQARYTVSDIQRLLADPDYRILTLAVQDIYGDMGIVGAAVVHTIDSPAGCTATHFAADEPLTTPDAPIHTSIEAVAVIEAFFLSCRAFDRYFEDYLLQQIQERFPNNLTGIYIKSAKNHRFQDFYYNHGVTLYEK
ncbi:MAG: HAD-IIIC family phosphatase [Lachnospiraceae bacterium]|nr:HAD-IIIC family phosphatase [Lachnospiraceae bacterium]